MEEKIGLSGGDGGDGGDRAAQKAPVDRTIYWDGTAFKLRVEITKLGTVTYCVNGAAVDRADYLAIIATGQMAALDQIAAAMDDETNDFTVVNQLSDIADRLRVFAAPESGDDS